MELGQFAGLGGGLAKKRGVTWGGGEGLRGVNTPMHTKYSEVA